MNNTYSMLNMNMY